MPDTTEGEAHQALPELRGEAPPQGKYQLRVRKPGIETRLLKNRYRARSRAEYDAEVLARLMEDPQVSELQVWDREKREVVYVAKVQRSVR